VKIIPHRFRPRFLIFALPFLFLTCSSESAERVSVIKQAFNTKDIDATIARCYSDDIKYEIDAVRGQGKQMRRGAAEWDSVINTSLRFSDFRHSVDTVFCKCVEENDISKLQGLERRYFDPVYFIFQHGRIKQMKFKSTEDSHKAEILAAAPFLHWLYNERSDRLPQLLTAGSFVYNAPTARAYLSLVREWYETAGKDIVR